MTRSRMVPAIGAGRGVAGSKRSAVELVEAAVGDVVAITARLAHALEYAGYGIEPDRDLVPTLKAARELQAGGTPARISAWLGQAGAPASPDDVATHLALLLAGFPNAGRDHDLGLYGRLLAEDVAAVEPSVGALAQAVRALRTTSEWLPSIAAVLAEVERQESKLRTAARNVTRLEHLIEQAATALPTLIGRAQARDAERRREAERRKPVVPGDRVKHVRWHWEDQCGMDYGTGIVVEPAPGVASNQALVAFDHFGLEVVHRRELRRLLPDEPGYLPAPDAAEGPQSEVKTHDPR